MNKTISVNIGGFVFNIEEDAYQKLYHYLSAIKQNFKLSKDCEEIMNDIEARIAEIFQSQNTHKQVVIDKDIALVIDIMGKPEDYVSDEFVQEGQNKDEKNRTYDQNTNTKRLFRDPEHSTIGGVCSGLSHYFDVDVTIIRVFFVVITLVSFGTCVLVYLTMLVVVPEAKSTADKLQMKGHSITLENIKDHFNNIKDEIKKNTQNGKFKKKFDTTINNVEYLGTVFFKTISKIIGIVLLMVGLILLPFFIMLFIGNHDFLPFVDVQNTHFLQSFIEIVSPSPNINSLIFLSIIVLVFLPILSMITSGVKLLFKIKQSFKPIGIVLAVIWFTALSFMIVSGVSLGSKFKSDTSLEYKISNEGIKDTLFIDVENDDKFSNYSSFKDHWDHQEFVIIEKEKVYLAYPTLIVKEEEDSSNFNITLYKESHGSSKRDAKNKAENIEYMAKISGNRLLLPQYFSIPKSDKLRGQTASIEVKIPKGKKIQFGENIDYVFVSVNGSHKHRKSSYSNTTWELKDDKLECMNCK